MAKRDPAARGKAVRKPVKKSAAKPKVKKATQAKRKSTASARSRKAGAAKASAGATRMRASAAKRAGPAAGAEPPTARAIQDAIEAAREWLGERRDYCGYLARRDATRGAPELARHLRGDLMAKQGSDGSWNDGDLAASAEAIWRLLDLGLGADSLAVSRGLDWLYSRRDAEGAYGSGCTPARHEQRVCEHYISGFFSPGPSDEPQEITLSNGQVVTADASARLLASARGLRSALRAKPDDPRANASVSGLRGLPLYLEYGGTFTPAVLVGALQALAWVEGVWASELEAGLETLVAAQEEDGCWPNVEFFFVLETLLEINHPLAQRMLKRTIPRILESQHKYGAWGRRHVATQTWIAVQVLERALNEQRGSRS